MKILHVLSQFEVTGAEAYAASLIDEQVQAGHSAIVVSDTFSLQSRATYIPLPIGQRSYSQRFRNVISLVRLIRKHSIDIVHAHSRAASWVSFFATRVTRTPFVSTVHGRQHIHASSKSYSIYGKDIIAVSAALKDHLIADLGINSEYLAVIPNGILPSFWRGEAPSSPAAGISGSSAGGLVVFIGRLTGPKGDVVRLLLTKVLPRVVRRKMISFQSIGGMITPEDIPRLCSDLNAELQRPVAELRGFQRNIADHILNADLIIGSGRVVPESLALRRPVIAFGESNYVGPITQESFENASVTNFGDTGIPEPANPDVVAADILRIVEHPPAEAERAALAELVNQRYSSKNVAEKIHRIYERAIARARSPKAIPVLMYHRVLDRPAERSSHGIWITAGQFADQLRSLRSRGFETITFRDYSRFLRGETRLPRRPIILTFDDGYQDNYTNALPLLQKFGCRAVIFAVTDGERRMNFWDQQEPCAALLTSSELRELDRCGIEIGSHTVTHPKLTAIPAGDARRELRTSKETLEQLLGSEVISFAYPYGAVHRESKNLVEEAGYRFAAAGDEGPTTLYSDFFQIRRTQVFPWTSQIGFWKKSLPMYYQYKNLKN